MQEYAPAKPYTKIATEPWAKELWAFLNKKDNLIRMETAIDLNKPPLEGVLKNLERQYQSRIVGEKNHNNRKMIGHMIGQIVTNRLKAQNRHQRTSIRRDGSNFKSATKFKLGIGFGPCTLKEPGCTALEEYDAVSYISQNGLQISVCSNCKPKLN